MYANALKNGQKIFAVAPMMDWTDRHCRFFHRQLSKHALLYSEMVTADAVIHGNRQKLIGFSKQEHPLVLQLGGNDPVKLSEAAKIGEDFGYDEINLNVGCPSDRVQNGTFGACLMREPKVVAACVRAMKTAVDIPVTVKCRIGVDEQDPIVALDDLAYAIIDNDVDAIWVHARKAWLQGLSPKENRDIPPLDYERVNVLKKTFSSTFIGVNGGIHDVYKGKIHTVSTDGIMLGRAAYQNASILVDVDHAFYNEPNVCYDYDSLADQMVDYCAEQMAGGVRLSAITRHMIGLFHGLPGAKRYRQILSEEARLEDAKPDIIKQAFAAVRFQTSKQDAA